MQPMKKKKQTWWDVTLLVWSVAIPIALSSGLQVLMQAYNTHLLGHADRDGIYLFSLFLPFYFVILAITEGMRLTAQVNAAVKEGEGSRQDILPLTATLAGYEAVVLGITLLFFWLASTPLCTFFRIPDPLHATFVNFVLGMVLAQIAVMPGRLLLASLQGIGRVGFSLCISTVAALAYLALLTYLRGQPGFGLLSIVLGTVLYAGFLFALAVAGVSRFLPVGTLFARPTRASLRLGYERYVAVGFPITASYGLIFVSAFLFNRIVVPFGEVVTAGFGVAYRFQTFIIMPAIAIGSATAILANQRIGANKFKEVYRIFRSGLASSSFLYGGITAVVLLFPIQILALFTDDAALVREGSEYLVTVGPTYIWMGVLIALLVFMEETGDGYRALVLNVTYFGLIVAVGWWLAASQGDVSWFYGVYACCNLLGLGVIYREWQRIRKLYTIAAGRRHR